MVKAHASQRPKRTELIPKYSCSNAWSMPRSIAFPSWSIAEVPPAVWRRYPWRETKWSKVPCLKVQRDGRGLNTGPPDPEFEVLTTRPRTPPQKLMCRGSSDKFKRFRLNSNTNVFDHNLESKSYKQINGTMEKYFWGGFTCGFCIQTLNHDLIEASLGDDSWPST